ncbi:uncharacterized protein J4E79_008448 [Alternaria viburni]|uniref:uncharacterized protein n=1 Tax=Alternaria viburni TaxID=566460 RepID=UPI0020C305C2|nr:uncharacterized protein J4E79_008448 [Alternaria viburni]KAI4654574.1 hypothetical protein J4E79_008448 [Alternaria viburni]
MKQRITYVVTNPEEFTPDQLQVGEDQSGPYFALDNVYAAKEHRITLGLNELPEEVYTPDDALCSSLHSLISSDLKCLSTSSSSTKMPVLSERFSMSATSQYYSYLDDIDRVRSFFQQKFCKKDGKSYCLDAIDGFALSDYVDVDYDTISRSVVLTAESSNAGSAHEGWTETIRLPSKGATVEIGVLSLEGNADPEDVQFGGFLTVLGQDDKPKPTRFQTPTRHYPLLQASKNPTAPPKLHPLTYSTSFNQPTGLHPTLTLTFPAHHLTPPDRSCKLHTHLTLPSYLFIDKYQFSDALFLADKNLKRLRSLAGATDLEAPDWNVPAWGSAALFELATPKPEKIEYPKVSLGDGEESVWEDLPTHREVSEGDWNVSIPLHLRYMPAQAASHARLPVPWPVVFWACRADSGAQHTSNPFDRLHLGYEGLFGPKTRFMHVEPKAWNQTESGGLVEWIDVPVLDTRMAGWVEGGTVGVVLFAFVGLCWMLFRNIGKGDVKDEKKTQ